MTERNEAAWQAARELGCQVTAENYTEWAVQTESPAREMSWSDEEIQSWLRFIQTALRVTDAADFLKKRYFYGHRDVCNLQQVDRELLEDKIFPSSTPEKLTALQMRLLHGLLGYLSEVGELLYVWHKHVAEAAPLDKVNWGEELGDLRWYGNQLELALDLPPLAIQQANIAKLAFRYPARFHSEHAAQRDTAGERALLETFLNPQ